MERMGSNSPVMKVFGDVEPFLRSSDDFLGNTMAKLLEYFADSTKMCTLKVELASVVDAGKPFVEATYVFLMQEPRTIELGHELRTGIGRDIGVKRDTFQYVPLLDGLKSLLQNQENS